MRVILRAIAKSTGYIFLIFLGSFLSVLIGLLITILVENSTFNFSLENDLILKGTLLFVTVSVILSLILDYIMGSAREIEKKPWISKKIALYRFLVYAPPIIITLAIVTVVGPLLAFPPQPTGKETFTFCMFFKCNNQSVKIMYVAKFTESIFFAGIIYSIFIKTCLFWADAEK